MTKKKAYYFLWQVEILGRLSTEIMCLKSLFADTYELHIITTNPYVISKVNCSVFDILTRDITVSFTDNYESLMFVYNNRGNESALGIIDFDDYVIIALSPEKLVDLCINKFGRHGFGFICNLNQHDKQKGAELREALCNREMSYMQISHEYIRLNPDFLGHSFVHSVTDLTHKLIHA